MHQSHIHIAVLRQLQRLAGAGRDNITLVFLVASNAGQIWKQFRVFSARSGRQLDDLLGEQRQGRGQQPAQHDQPILKIRHCDASRNEIRSFSIIALVQAREIRSEYQYAMVCVTSKHSI